MLGNSAEPLAEIDLIWSVYILHDVTTFTESVTATEYWKFELCIHLRKAIESDSEWKEFGLSDHNPFVNQT